MFCTILNQDTDAVVETREATREEMRPRLLELRAAKDGNSYVMFEGETADLSVAAVKAYAVENRESKIKREEYLASLPEVSGPEGITKEQWDEAMTKLGQRNKYQAANLAAHSWAVLPHDDGLILIGHGRPAYLLSGDTTTNIDVPPVCQSCFFARTHLNDREERRAGILVCSIGYQDGPMRALRKVNRVHTCAGWKPDKS